VTFAAISIASTVCAVSMSQTRTVGSLVAAETSRESPDQSTAMTRVECPGSLVQRVAMIRAERTTSFELRPGNIFLKRADAQDANMPQDNTPLRRPVAGVPAKEGLVRS
jgi:hypothetical protein